MTLSNIFAFCCFFSLNNNIVILHYGIWEVANIFNFSHEYIFKSLTANDCCRKEKILFAEKGNCVAHISGTKSSY